MRMLFHYDTASQLSLPYELRSEWRLLNDRCLEKLKKLLHQVPSPALLFGEEAPAR